MSIVNIARCPEHGLHGERTECFVCRGPVKQVPMAPVPERDNFTDGRYVIADTTAQGARDPIMLTSQVKFMRDGMARCGASPGLILVVVDDPERKAAVERIRAALTGGELGAVPDAPPLA